MKLQPASIISYRLRSVRCAQGLVPPLLGFLLALITAALFASAGSTFAAGPGSTAASPRFAPGHILVAPQPGSADADFQQALIAQDGRSLGRLQGIDVYMVEVPPGSEQDAVARLAGNPHVRFAELDQLAPPAGTANDPYFGNEWHLAKINAPTAWHASTGIGITIAILDSGVDGTHPDLAAQMVPGWNFFDNNSNTADVFGHGTAVAGAAAAASNDGVGIAGVAGGARIMPVRIADVTGYAYWSTAAQGLTWAADHGAQVANISFEGMAASSTMQAAATYFRSKGGAVIVAAGNTGAVDNTMPTDTMIVVSATDNEDRITSWSTYGSFVAISAPGQDIYSTAMGGGYESWSGTSMAASIVTGTAALILALRPELTPAQVASTLRTTATDLGAIGPDIYYGYGRVDAAAAVQAASAAPTDATPPKAVQSKVRSLPACKHAQPTILMTPSQSAGVQAATMVPFDLTVTNNDTTACDVSTFDLTRSVPSGWTATLLSLVMSLSPGSSSSATLQVTSPTGTTNSSNLVTATATNRSANKFLRSASATYVVANAVPGAPTIGTATASNAQATVSFTAPASNGGSVITAYTVTPSPGGITASGASSPITVTGLTNGAAYTFTVKATNAVGTGAASAASNAVTPAAPIVVPGAPTIGTATAGNAQASVTFTAPTANGGSVITAYTVTSSPGGITASGASSPITVTGLTNGTAYTFTVKATNAVGTGAASAASNAVTPAAPIVVPAAPTIGTATAGNAQASVSFIAPASNGGSAITAYTVTSSPGGRTASGASSPITVTGLTNGTAYTFTVKATNAVGTGAASAASNAITPAAPIAVPGAPTIGAATAGNAQASVSFSAPASNGGSAITAYTVTSSPGGITASGASSPITVTGLTNGTAYTFTVKATNAVGTGAASAASNAVTPAAPIVVPGAPTIGAATAGNAQASVSFTAPVSNGGSVITAYTVTSSPGGITASGAASPLTVTGLTNGTAYTFTVKAINVAGSGVASAASNAVTPTTQWAMGYYAGWEVTEYPVSEIDWASLTHIAVAFYLVSPNGTVDDSLFLDHTKGPALAHSLVNAAHANGRKAIASFGGSGSGDGFIGATSATNRAAFIQAIKNVVTTYSYDGVDIDWEPNYSSQVSEISALINGLRAAMPTIIITMTADIRNNNLHPDLSHYAAVQSKLDQVNIMTYGMAGDFGGWLSWHSSPLYWNNNSATPTGINNTVDAYIAAGVPAAKLGIGSGFYGLAYTSPVTAPAQALNGGTTVGGDQQLSYRNILTLYYSAAAYHWDSSARVPYLSFTSPHGPEQSTYVSYENEQSIGEKTAYLKAKGLGGIIIWTMGEGYIAGNPAGQRNPLLKAIGTGLSSSQ